MGDIDEYPFSFMNAPSSLQLLASTEVALVLWRYSMYSTSNNNLSLDSFLRREFSCEEILVVPSSIRAEIDEKIATIREELKKWWEFHWKRGIFVDGDFLETFSKCLNCIVVNHLGAVSFKSTAINILNSGNFNSAEGYKLACMFCLGNEVRRIRRLAGLSKNIHKRVCPANDLDLLRYWNWRMKKNRSLNYSVDLESQLVNLSTEGNWPAFEYFWKRYSNNDGEKVSLTVSFIDRDRNQAVIRLLPTLNLIQAAEVFEERPAQVLRILVLNEKYFQHVYRLWAVLGRTVMENKPKFYQVLHELWKMVFNCPDTKLGLNYDRCGQINQFLLEIWSNAEDQLKVYFSNNYISEFIDRLSLASVGFSCYYGQNTAFLLELLRNSPNEIREKRLRTHWRKLVLRTKPSSLQQLMKLCLPNDDEAIELFKEQMLDFKEMFTFLIEHGFYSDLRDYLVYCSKNKGQLNSLSKKILEQNFRTILLHDDDKFVRFDRFVDEIFSKQDDLKDEFKMRMITSVESLKYLHGTFSKKNHWNEFNRIIDRFASSERKLQTLKYELLDHCRRHLEDSEPEDFFAEQWQKMLEWCTSSNADEILAFRRSLNVDEIFLKQLEHFYRTEMYTDFYIYRGLRFFDGFLRWYFSNVEEEVKKFKVDKIMNYERIDVICAMMESPYHRSAMDNLLKWAFDEDSVKIGEFWGKCT